MCGLIFYLNSFENRMETNPAHLPVRVHPQKGQVVCRIFRPIPFCGLVFFFFFIVVGGWQQI
jgi:hypothetical protein